MASSLTLYPMDRKAVGSNHLAVQFGGTVPATGTMSTGWTVDTVALDNYSLMSALSKRASSGFGSTAQPSTAPDNTLGDCLRTERLSGSFVSGNWDFSLPVVASVLGGLQGGKFRIRIWRSSNADGSSAFEITGSAQVTSAVTGIIAASEQACTLTYNPGAFSMQNQFLFFQVAWHVTVAALSITSDVMMRSGVNSRIITPAFTSAEDIWKTAPGAGSGV